MTAVRRRVSDALRLPIPSQELMNGRVVQAGGTPAALVGASEGPVSSS